MNALILFATNSGGTQTAAEAVSTILSTANHQVALKNPSQATFEDLSGADFILLASPSWDYETREGQPHEDFFALMSALKDKSLPGKKFAILGLGDSSYTHFCGGVDHLEAWVKQLQGTLVVPSLKIDGFFYHQTEHMETITKWANTLVTVLEKA